MTVIRESTVIETDGTSLRARLDTVLTVDLIATPTPLVLAEEDRVAAVKEQMSRTGFDVLPVSGSIKEFWVHPNAIPTAVEVEPVRKHLDAADLIAASTPVLEVLQLMVNQQRRFYFVLRAAAISGLVTPSDFDKRPVRTAAYAVSNAVEQALLVVVGHEHGEDGSYRQWLTTGELKFLDRKWAEARQGDIELSPLHYTSLAQLTTIANESPRIRPVLDSRLGPGWRSEMDHFRECLRNPVLLTPEIVVVER